MKRALMLLTFLIIASALYAQAIFSNRDAPYLSLDAGPGSSDALVNGMSFGFFLEPKLNLTSAFAIGNKSGVNFSTDNIVSMESQLFLRWNFLRLGSSHNTTNIFIQAGAGVFGALKGDDVKDSRSSILIDAALGITIPLSSRWHIEPSVRAGYPFIGGGAITIGYKFPLGKGLNNLEYTEVIRRLPPNEIIKRVLISQVEYIIFAPDVSRFNAGLDRDAVSLNELVIGHTARILADNPDFRVRIEGHANPVTHNPGELEELIALSEARANEVARLFRERGVKDEQIIVIAYGGTRVVANDHDHWNMNRRVELIIVQIDTEME